MEDIDIPFNYDPTENRINDHQFIHFNLISQCDQFIVLLNQSNINIVSRCCAGLGCSVLNNDFNNSIVIKNSYIVDDYHIPIVQTNLIDTVIVDICCVCLDDTNTTTKCNHHLCNRCYNLLNNKICPCCRHTL